MVFVPYRGFYFLNNQQTQHSQTCERTVFVPYRGFYFLNICNRNDFGRFGVFMFSSPIGAFIFLIILPITNVYARENIFVPYRGFYFLNRRSSKSIQFLCIPIFVPYRGFYFLNPGLTILVFMRVKKMFCGVNLF